MIIAPITMRASMPWRPEVLLSFSKYTAASSSQGTKVASFTQWLSGESSFSKGVENLFSASWFDGVYLIITARLYGLKLRKPVHLYNGNHRFLINNILIVNNLHSSD